jgi:hypothetical protein
MTYGYAILSSSLISHCMYTNKSVPIKSESVPRRVTAPDLLN